MQSSSIVLTLGTEDIPSKTIQTTMYLRRTQWEIALTQEIIRDRSTFLPMTSSLFPAVYLCVRQYKQKRFLIWFVIASFQDSEGFFSALRAELPSAYRNGCAIEFSPKRTSAINAICANQGRANKQANTECRCLKTGKNGIQNGSCY